MAARVSRLPFFFIGTGLVCFALFQIASLADFSAWLADLRAEYTRMVDEVDEGAETFLDPYAAEDEAEFFAVATEDFIDRPALFESACPVLYGLMREFYGVDPAAWPVDAAPS